VKRQWAADDRRKVIIEPNTKNIMDLLEPLYQDFRKRSEKLTASFTDGEMKIIEAYLSQAIEIMQETTKKLNSKS
jgi:hypothetical protein